MLDWIARHLGLVLGAGIPIFAFAMIALMTSVTQRIARDRIERGRAEAAPEGVVLDSGLVKATIRYRNYSAPGIVIGVGIRAQWMVLMLTGSRLVILPSSRHYCDVPRAELSRYTVGVAANGRLQLHTETPFNATGSVDYQIGVPDVQLWIQRLKEAGARTA